MNEEKFISEVTTLEKFFAPYCKSYHKDQTQKTYLISYKNSEFTIDSSLCKECDELLLYSFERLKECPHEEKPRCRKCKNNCYEKSKFNHLANIMRYSGIFLGFKKMKNSLSNLLN